MNSLTHRKFSVAFALAGGVLLHKLGLMEVNYFAAAPVLLLAAKYGALLPDVDREWANLKEKNVPNRIINGAIHLTGGRHRSWQTHSWDVFCLLAAAVYIGLAYARGQSWFGGAETYGVVSVLCLGVFLGWLSHLVADMLTPVGIRVLCWRKQSKVSFVPGGKWGKHFATGTGWEQLVCKFMGVVNFVLGVMYLVYGAWYICLGK